MEFGAHLQVAGKTVGMSIWGPDESPIQSRFDAHQRGVDSRGEGARRPFGQIAEAERAGGRPVSWKRGRSTSLAIVVGLIGLIAASAAFVLQVGHDAPWPVVAGDQLVGLSYLIAGTIAWLRRPANRIGPTIAGAGVTWFIADFVLVPIAGISALAYAVMWVPVLFDAFLLLAYPTGRFFSSTARRLFVLSAAVSIVQYAVRLVLLPTTPDYGCVCLNPFALLPNVGLYDAVMLVTRILSVVVALTILGLIVQRWRLASPAGRRQLTPVLFAGIVGLAAFAADIAAYMAANGASPFNGITGTVLVIARAAVPIGFLLGLVRTRLDHALVGQLVVQLGQAPSPERLEEVLGTTVHDQTLRVAYWSPAAQAYLDGRGRLVQLAVAEDRAVTIVDRGGSPLAAIEYDAVLSDEPDLLRAVAAALELSVDRSRLETMVQAQITESRSLPRGRVTLLYSDIEGSTALLDRLGTRYADVLSEQRRLLRAIVLEHGGREIDSRADEYFAVFPGGSTPAGAALAIQRRLRDHAWPEGVLVRVRIGLHSGEPEVGDEGYVGMDVHLVARLGAAGHGGQILVSASARDIIAGELTPDMRLLTLGAFELRGIPGLHEILQLVVPDLPSEFPPPRLADPRPPARPLA
jgi:class 3 adenylate cyclase